MFPVTIRGRRGRQSSQAGRPRRRGAIPRLEGLEGRTTPSTFVVTNAQDSGEGSLRWALGQANAHPGDDVVGLSPALAGRPIVLTSGGLVATDPTGLTAVVGLGAPASAVVRSPAARAFSVFEVLPLAQLSLSGLTISGGRVLSEPSSAGRGGGGGVLNRGRLGMEACTVANNSAYYVLMSSHGQTWTSEGEGSGIHNTGTMTLTNCTVTGNLGGGVSNDGTATLSNCTVASNRSTGVVNSGSYGTQATVTLSACTVAGNQGNGVVNYSGTTTLTSCALSGNGTGVYVTYGIAKLTGCTVLSNQGNGVEIFGSYGNGTAELNNCTVAGNRGNGFHNYVGTATLTNCTVAGNLAGGVVTSSDTIGFGGASLNSCTVVGNRLAGVHIFGRGSLTNCTVAGNQGDGVSAFLLGSYWFSTATLINCAVTGNQGDGVKISGGVYNGEGKATFLSCTISGNRGDGVNNSNGAVTLTNCTLAGNVRGVDTIGTATLTACTLVGHSGSAVYNHSGTATLITCTLAGNGTGVVNHGTAALTNCSLARNKVSGVANPKGNATLTNCTVSGNGAGVANYNTGTATLTNCTLAGNKGPAVTNGGSHAGVATTAIVNSILWGNGGATGTQIAELFGTVSVSHSIVQGGWAGEGNGAADPLFLDAARGDYRLRPGSPAIDAGDNGAAPAFDAHGNPRPIDGDRDGTATATADLGAFEFGRPIVTLASSAPAVTRTAIRVRVTFSDPVAGFTARDVTTTNATVSAFRGSGTSYSFTLTPATQGAFGARLAFGAAHDDSGNPSTASNLLRRAFVPLLLAFQGVPAQAVVNGALPPLAVQLHDSYGNPIALPGRLVTLSLPGGALAGTLTALTDASGRAVFRDLRVLTAGAFRLRASSPGLADAWSAEFAVAEGGPPWARLLSALGRLPDRLRDALQGLPWPGL